jgi:hypothetical protein
MARILSVLVATVVLLSAAAEIASFLIDHKSWLAENFAALRSYVTASREAEAPVRPDCTKGAEGCTPDRPATARRGCDDIEPMSKKILCLITLPKAAPPCTGAGCEKTEPGKRGLEKKGDMAVLEPKRE